MSKTRESIEKELEQNIPRDAVSSRSGGGSKQLSYLETWYVIDRLNKVFGNLGWDSETVEITQVNGADSLPAYRCRVRITVACPAYDESGATIGFRNVIKEGTGWGSDKSKQNAHEMAVKEAESDALKRAAMKLGISMGLGLYDKSGEFVDDAPAPRQINSEPTNSVTKQDSAHKADPAANIKQPSTAGVEREALQKRITAMSKIVIAKQVKTLDELKAQMKADYNVAAAKDMTDAQAQDLLTKLEKLASGG